MERIGKKNPGWYKPAKLYMGKVWYVEYAVHNPQTNDSKLIRHKCNKGRTKLEKRRTAQEFINNLNTQLATGWRPAGFEVASLSDLNDIDLFAAMKEFLKHKKREVGKSWFEKLTYNVDGLKRFLNNKKGIRTIRASEFTSILAIEYMDYIYFDRNVSNRTFNNYLMTVRCIFNWMERREHIKKNPFRRIKKKKVKRISRATERTEYMGIIQKHLLIHDRWFLVICYLLFHGLIRLTEISRLRVKDVYLDRGVIIVHAEDSKNGRPRVVTMAREVIEFLRALKLESCNPDHYLIGYERRPGKDHCCPRRYSERWRSLRNRLNLPKNMTLYSLKYIGINELLNNGVLPRYVQEQAGHKSLSTTTKYALISIPDGIPQITVADLRFSEGTQGK